MRIKSVVLEHHCDVAILRSYVVYKTVANVNFTFRKKIQYEINRKNGKIDVVFYYDGKPRGEEAKPIDVNVMMRALAKVLK